MCIRDRLRAFAAVKKELPDTAIVIAGPGEENTVNSLRTLSASLGIARDVVWTGPLYEHAKWNALRAAEAVSYTHLDVYKRQARYYRARCDAMSGLLNDGARSLSRS